MERYTALADFIRRAAPAQVSSSPNANFQPRLDYWKDGAPWSLGPQRELHAARERLDRMLPTFELGRINKITIRQCHSVFYGHALQVIDNHHGHGMILLFQPEAELSFHCFQKR
jgi:hypothetical protein